MESGELNTKPYKLTFSEEMEKAYLKRYFQDSLNVLRIAFPIVIALYGLFGFLDIAIIPEFKTEFHIVRYGIVMPFLIAVYISSFFQFFERVWQWLLLASFIVGGLGLIYMTARSPENFTYYLGLMLVFSAGYFFIKLRFKKATLGGWLLVIFFNIAMIGFSDASAVLILAFNFFYIAANVINMFAAYYIELFNRKNFQLNHQLALERQALEKANQNLESEVAKQTKELVDSEQSLKKLNSTKDRFISIIAHDLRNPIGSFKQLAEAIDESYHELTDQERLRFIQLMRNSSESVFLLLENLLEWARSKEGDIILEPTDLLLHNQVEKTIQVLQASALSKNISINNKIPRTLTVTADPAMLDTILRNLLSNAIKYSRSDDKIIISADEDEDCTKISVADTGIGISDELKSNLFSIDNNVKTSGTKNEKGTGLGLILCQEFVKQHGGKIWVESEEGKGSTFYVELPLRH